MEASMHGSTHSVSASSQLGSSDNIALIARSMCSHAQQCLVLQPCNARLTGSPTQHMQQCWLLWATHSAHGFI